ncbi:MAG: hypothetical protein PHQ54_03560 [Candidatus Omnitrophica bacterium]|nr:hypothetical protein [Candidatus Omnitrophota bacterium]
MSENHVQWRNKCYFVYPGDHPHLVVSTAKKLHGWWRGSRECTSERMLINPYCGCSVGCRFCYARSFPGWFQLFRDKNIIVVAKDFQREVSRQLDSIDVASCGYLSPVSDPFQPLNNKFHISELIIDEFTKRNIPIEFITKCRVPASVLDKLTVNRHNFGQVSILTGDSCLNRILVPNGAHHQVLFDNIMRMSKKNIFSVLRIDPVLPYLNDKKQDLKELIKKASVFGAKHVITSVLDIPVSLKNEFLDFVKSEFGTNISDRYRALYTERIGNYWHAKLAYRLSVFDFLKNEVAKEGMSFALCMEYQILKDGSRRGLNKDYMTSVNCEGIDIPVYRRSGFYFYPASDCLGNCLNCSEAVCGIEDLAMAKDSSKFDWQLKDYKRWSKMLK